MTRDVCLMRAGSKEDGTRLFSVVLRDKTRVSGHKLQRRKFR